MVAVSTRVEDEEIEEQRKQLWFVLYGHTTSVVELTLQTNKLSNGALFPTVISKTSYHHSVS